jgi:hypothetical protein
MRRSVAQVKQSNRKAVQLMANTARRGLRGRGCDKKLKEFFDETLSIRRDPC